LPSKYCRASIAEQALPNKHCRGTPVIRKLLCAVLCPVFLMRWGRHKTPDIHHGEAVPAYFTQFRRLLGSKSVEVEQGTVDSGDIVESTAKYQPVQ
jgi:hypothetical protein